MPAEVNTNSCSWLATTTVACPPREVRTLTSLAPGAFSTVATCCCSVRAVPSWLRDMASRTPRTTTAARQAAASGSASRRAQALLVQPALGSGCPLCTCGTGGSCRVLAAAVSTRSRSPAGGAAATASANLVAVSCSPRTSLSHAWQRDR